MNLTEGTEFRFADPEVFDAFDLAVRTGYAAWMTADVTAAHEAGRAFDELFRLMGGDRDVLKRLVAAAVASGPENWPRKPVDDA